MAEQHTTCISILVGLDDKISRDAHKEKSQRLQSASEKLSLCVFPLCLECRLHRGT